VKDAIMSILMAQCTAVDYSCFSSFVALGKLFLMITHLNSKLLYVDLFFLFTANSIIAFQQRVVQSDCC
jgi:hypothetical protein